MLLRHFHSRRTGTYAVEAVVVYPILFFLVIGQIVGGMGVFRYQQVAHLSREAARFAAVHGGQYQQENAAAITAGQLPNVTEDYIKQQIVQAKAISMDASRLSVQVSFNNANGSFGWDDTANNGNRYPFAENSDGTAALTNTVSVTVTYQWFPESLLIGPYTITSTSVIPMSY